MQNIAEKSYSDSSGDLLAELNQPALEPMARAEWLLVSISMGVGLVLLGGLAWWVRA
jgi:hypothetical protein